jgi:predicted DCC family thiol-disulfide oxidoreductase YuxK
MSESSGVLIYDGDCGFCTTCAHWIEGHWPTDGPTAVPWQRLGAQLSELGLNEHQVAEAAWWVDDFGTASGEIAIAKALAATRTPLWRSVGRTLERPAISQAAAPIYRLVVRHRHRLPGASETCRVEDHR